MSPFRRSYFGSESEEILLPSNENDDRTIHRKNWQQHQLVPPVKSYPPWLIWNIQLITPEHKCMESSYLMRLSQSYPLRVNLCFFWYLYFYIVIKSKCKNELKKRLALKNSNSKAARRSVGCSQGHCFIVSQNNPIDHVNEKAVAWLIMASKPFT